MVRRPLRVLYDLPELSRIAAWFRRALNYRKRILDPPSNEYRLTRVVFLRCLGLVYSVAFLGLALQLAPLLGERGLLPAHLYLARIESAFGEGWPSFFQVPTLMWLDVGDTFMAILAWAGLCLALMLLAGWSSGLHLLALWVLYTSFVNIGQLFYGYGWEILLLETGFLAVFLCPSFLPGAGKGAQSPPPPKAVIWLLKWTLFRVVFGAGLIKLRGDPCWRDLTCLIYHYETQPIPNPLSWYLHQLPAVVHKLGVVFNHLVEIVASWLLLGPRRLRLVGGILVVVFQLLLIASGNLSWLNYVTLTLCVPCFDDRAWRWFRARVRRLPRGAPATESPTDLVGTRARSLSNRVAVGALVGVVLYLSVAPVANMVSSRQVMNTSFDRLNLVNTYGAFGSVGKVRREVIIQGTADAQIGEATQWREYEFKCKPGDPSRRPCVLSPYHLRVDWQIWFAAMSDYRRQPWLVHLVYKLLLADPGALSLLGRNPFPGKRPTFVRAELFEYEFTGFDGSGDWWKRRRIGQYLPPVSAQNPALLRVLRGFGWPTEDDSGVAESAETASSSALRPPAADPHLDLDACGPCGHS